MYITLSQTPDRDGFQGQVALNTARINGFREVSFKDIGGMQGMWEHIQKY